MISYTTEKIFKNILISDPRPALRGASLLCPQKQCFSGKEDGLSGRTNQRLPPGGSSRRSRARESALRYNQYKSKVARAPSVTLRSEPPKLISFASGNPYRVPPSSQRKAILSPDSTPKRCNTLYLAGQGVRKKDREREILCPFAVGANCVRPRAFTERPYEDDFLSVGKPALWKAPLPPSFFIREIWSS